MRTLIIFVVFLSTLSSSAQTERRPWFFGLGINAVDYQTEPPTGLNTTYSAIRLSLGRQVWKDLSVEVSYAMNTINNYPEVENAELDHSAVDLSLWYSFRRMIYEEDQGLIDPYIGVGAGISYLENPVEQTDQQSNTLNAFAGLNFWINDNFAIVGQGQFKNSTDDYASSYIEYLLGIRYAFSFNSNSICFP